jgi:RluA family pseudouridine synthase
MEEAIHFQISDYILWIDEAILLINKPAGLLTIRDGYNPGIPFLIQILGKEIGQVWVVHRLDRDTSGILIVARTAQAHQNLNLQFEHRTIKKAYHAITIGIPDRDRFTIDVPLSVDGDRRHRTTAYKNDGKSATTDFTVLEKYKRNCLIEAHPTTGYTHQIRAHLLAAGYPILSDMLYKPKIETKPNVPVKKIDHQESDIIKRLALHARSITFTHPLTGQLLEIKAPYPDDFKNAINQLRQQI